MKTFKPGIDSLIGAGTRITGDIEFAGGMRVDGEVKGNVKCRDDESGVLILGQHARIEGILVAPRMSINGTVIGQAFSTGVVELLPGARIAGDIHYKSLVMHPGAIVDGQLFPTASPVRAEEREPQRPTAASEVAAPRLAAFS